MKRLLYITAFPPNHMSGGQTFTYNAISNLRKSFKIDLIYYGYKDHKYEPIEGVNLLKVEKPSYWSMLLLPMFHPIFTKRFSLHMLFFLRRIIPNYDVVYFDFSQASIYSLFLRHDSKIVRCHDILAQKFQRKSFLSFLWIRLCERMILKTFKRIFVPSIKDAAIVRKLYSLKAAYTHEYLDHFEIRRDTEFVDGFVLYGHWARKENFDGLIWFIDNVVKPNRDFFSGRIFVLGGGLSDKQREQALDPYNIKYLGFIPDIYAEIVKYNALIAPIFQGAGVKVKVLDAFNTGTPVIGTDIAFEGISKLDGLMIRARTPEEFFHSIASFRRLDADSKIAMQKHFLSVYDKRHLSDFLK